MDRREFLDQRRAVSRRRYDELHSPTYDETWGATCDPTHVDHVARIVAATVAGDEILDAACGTGKYWPQLLAAGRRPYGVDQSKGMLAKAREKDPGAGTQVLALQELVNAAELHGRFPALICVDAIENVGPEDWPVVLAGLRATLRPGGIAYLTVEIPETDAPIRHAGDPLLLDGELFDGAGYHYYPADDDVRAWLTGAGLNLEHDSVGDGYWHLICRQRHEPQ
jgi:cyclopropane fatty-acyl-phospholipid synthase-like methyltransferase